MTSEHLRPVLDTLQDAQLLFKMGQQLSRAQAPSSIASAIRLGTITALQKPNGGDRGIVVGDTLRRLVARTIAQQLSVAVEAATAPFQYALSTRAGTECVAHALQSLTEENPTTTVMSIDGIGAFDLVSRKAMLQALMSIESGSAAIPFARMFYGQASTYLWEDNEGHVHRIEQGEGGEQGDPMMPLLFALGQHTALSAIQGSLDDEVRLLAFHDDLYVLTQTLIDCRSCMGPCNANCGVRSRIRMNEGKTQVWNSGGVRPGFCDTLERIARVTDPEALVWRGSGLPTEQLGIRVLGTPLGHDDFVATQLQECLRSHQVLLDRIPEVTDVQSAWALLLHCASARANYMLRVVRPELVEDFAVGHDLGLWTCLCRLLNVNPDNNSAKVIAGSPLSLGGLGLRSATKNPSLSLLGELGRQPLHDQSEASCCGGEDHWFFEQRTSSWTLHSISSSGRLPADGR